MFENRANLEQLRFDLLKEIRQHYPEGEASSISRLILDHCGFPLQLCLREPHQVPGPEVHLQIKEIVSEIHTGKPIQYILGFTEFFGLKITLNESVLIPRPETEELVYHIIRSPGSPKRIMDLGTGSGCLALALKKNDLTARVSALDNSAAALELARSNARDNQLEIEFRQTDLLAEPPPLLEQSFDLIVSNPPYVREGEKALMEKNVLEFEPHEALFVPDEDPLIFYRAIASFSQRNLLEGGELWVEINEALGDKTATLFMQAGFRHLEIIKDIHHKDRFIHAGKK